MNTSQILNPLTEAEELRRGQLLVTLLNLKPVKGSADPSPNYKTEWGTKTALGLFRTVARVVIDGE